MPYDLPISSIPRRNKINQLARMDIESFTDGLGPPPTLPPPTPPTPPRVPTPTPIARPPTGAPPPFLVEPAPQAVPTRMTDPRMRSLQDETVRTPYTERGYPTGYGDVDTTDIKDPNILRAAEAAGLIESSTERQDVLDSISRMQGLAEIPEMREHVAETNRRLEAGFPGEAYTGPGPDITARDRILKPIMDYDHLLDGMVYMAVDIATTALTSPRSPTGQVLKLAEAVGRSRFGIGITGVPFADPAERIGKFQDYMTALTSGVTGVPGLPPDYAISEDFSREAQRQRQFEHERIRRLYDIGVTTQDLLQGTGPEWTPTGTYSDAIQSAIDGDMLPWYVTEPLKVFLDPVDWALAGAARPLAVSLALLAKSGGRGVITLGGAGIRHMPGVSMVLTPAKTREVLYGTGGVRGRGTRIRPEGLAKDQVEHLENLKLSKDYNVQQLYNLRLERSKTGANVTAIDEQIESLQKRIRAIGEEEVATVTPEKTDIKVFTTPTGGLTVAEVAYNSGPFTSFESSWYPQLLGKPGARQLLPTSRAYSWGPTDLPREGLGQAALEVKYFPGEADFIGPRLTGNAVVYLDAPNRYVVGLPPKTRAMFPFDPTRGGLTKTQTVLATVSDLSQHLWGHFDEHATAAGTALVENWRRSKGVAATTSRVLADEIYNAFDIDKDGLIQSLALDREGFPIDETLIGVAPTVQDVAARIPIYWTYLNDAQKAAMRRMKTFADNMNEILAEMEIPVPGNRRDIMEGDEVMDGGFYLHRGNAHKVGPKILGIELPDPHVSVGTYWESKPGFLKAEGFDSMAEAIQGVTHTRPQTRVSAEPGVFHAPPSEHSTFRYPEFREAMRTYIQDVGDLIAKHHFANYMITAVDSETGLRLAITKDSYLNATIKKQHSGFTRRVADARKSLARITAQSTILSDNVAAAHKSGEAQAARGERATEAAEARTQRAARAAELATTIDAQYTLLPLRWEMQEVTLTLRGAIRSALAASADASGMRSEIRKFRTMSRKTDRAIISLENRMDRLTAEANELYKAMTMEETPTPAGEELIRETSEIQASIDRMKRIRSKYAVERSKELKELEDILGELPERVKGVEDVSKAIDDYRIAHATMEPTPGARSTTDINADINKTRGALRRSTRPAMVARNQKRLSDLEEELSNATRRKYRTESAIRRRQGALFNKVWREVDKLSIEDIDLGEGPQPLRYRDLPVAPGTEPAAPTGPVSPLRFRGKAAGEPRTVRQPQPFTETRGMTDVQKRYIRISDLVDELDSTSNDLIEQSDTLQRELDHLSAREGEFKVEIAGDLKEARVREGQYRVLMKKEFNISSMRRVLRLLELEQGRIGRLMDREELLSQNSLSAAELRLAKNQMGQEKMMDKIEGLQTSLEDMRHEWQTTQERAAKGSPTESIIPVPGLGGYFFPDAVANAAKVYLRDVERSKAAVWAGKFLDAFNSLYRGARGTMDNSYMLVQGLLRAHDDPQAWASALRLNFHAWGIPRTGVGGERAIDAYIRHATEEAIRKGLPTPSELAGRGLVQTGADTEFTLGKGALSGLGKLPVIRNANRAFGATGDAMRIEWTYDLLEGMLKKKTYQEIIDSGDLAEVIKMVNAATGWSPGRFGGALGDLLLFAPRFLQSRFDTLSKAIVGLPSIATQPFGAYGTNPISKQATVGQRAAARSMLKMIGFTYTMTEGLNLMQGRETDWRPMIKIYEGTANERWIKNPNFARVRILGQDISLLGTWDSLLGLIITSGAIMDGQGPHKALRNVSSGGVAMAWDLISGYDAVGEPVRNGWKQTATRILMNFVPFSAEEMFSEKGHIDRLMDFGKDVKDDYRDIHERGESAGWGKHALTGLEAVGRAGMMAFELHGGKGYPMSTKEKINEQRLDIGRAGEKSGRWDMVATIDPDTGEETFVPRSQEDLDLIKEIFSRPVGFRDVLTTPPWKPGRSPNWSLDWGRGTGPPLDIQRDIDNDANISVLKAIRIRESSDRQSQLSKYMQEGDDARYARDDAFRLLQDEYWPGLTGSIYNPDDLLEGIQDAHKNYRTRRNDLDAEYSDLVEGLTPTREADSYFNRAVTRWSDLMYDPSLTDKLGRVDWDQREARQDQFDHEYPDMRGRVEAYNDKNDHPLIKALDQLKKDAEPWWDAHDYVQDYVFGKYEESSTRRLREYLLIRDESPDTASDFRRRMRNETNIIEVYEDMVDRRRRRMMTPEQDIARLQLGYGTAAKTRQGEEMRMRQLNDAYRRLEISP